MDGRALLRILAGQTGGDPTAAQDILLLQLRHMPRPDNA